MSLLDDLYDLLEDAQRYDRYIAARCIFHDDDKPSLMIYEDRYKCLACGANGQTSKLLDKLDHKFVPKVDQHKDYANPFTKWTKSHPLGKALQISYLNLKNTPSLGTYLVKERKIDIKILLQIGTGYRDDWYTFPIRDTNKCIVGAVARKSPTNNCSSKYIIPSGQNPNLLFVPDWKKVIDESVVFLTFGILDAISIYACGYAAMSTTTGKRIDPSAMDKIRKRIVLFPDHNEEFEAIDIARQLGWRSKVFECNYTMDAKDPNDLYCKYPDDFKIMLRDIVKGIMS